MRSLENCFYVLSQQWLVVLDDQKVIASTLHYGLDYLVLSEQGIARNQPAVQHQPCKQLKHGCCFVGLVPNGHLSKHHSYALAQGAQQVSILCSHLAAAS